MWKGSKFIDLFTSVVNAKNSHEFKGKLDKHLQRENPVYPVRYTSHERLRKSPKAVGQGKLKETLFTFTLFCSSRHHSWPVVEGRT